MRSRILLVLVLLLATTILAGCIGGDDPITADNGEDNGATHDDETGGIEGRILTVDLNEVARASIALVDGSELVAETRSGEDGRYSLSNVEPGDYRLQVSAACCRENVQGVTVKAGETISLDMQLERFTAADLQQPYVEERDWNGFMACAIGTPALTWATCSTLQDPNHDFLEHFIIGEGLKTVATGMTWDPAGGVLGESLLIMLENPDCGLNACSQQYASAEGESPLIFHASSPGGEWAFEAVEEEREIRYRVFPSFDMNVYYQQPFTVYYHLFYHEAAPEDYDPIPDA